MNTSVESDGEHILYNTTFIDPLNKTKEQDAAAAGSLQQIEQLSRNLEEKANTYRPLSHLGADLHLAINGLSKLEYMYRYSSTLYLSLFTSIFDKPAVPVPPQWRNRRHRRTS